MEGNAGKAEQGREGGEGRGGGEEDTSKEKHFSF